MKKRVSEFLATNLWLLKVMTVCTIAFYLARGASLVLAAELVAATNSYDSVAATRTSAQSRKTERARFQPQTGDVILARNIFDSITGPIDPNGPAIESVDDLEPEENKLLPFVPCDSSRFRLLATVASETAPDQSLAIVSDGKEQSLLKIGQREGEGQGEREVVWISWKHLVLKGSEDYCYIDMFDEDNISPKKRRRKARRSRSRGVKSTFAKGITKDGANEVTVARHLVNEVVMDPSKVTKGARFRPYKRNGKMRGFKLRRLSKRNPLSLLGAKRGDVIKEVNGIKLTSMDKVLGAYQDLRSAKELVFSITRRGRPIDLKVNIQ